MAKKKVKTKAEKERLQTIAEMPCYACFQDGREVQAEVHHIRKHTGMGLRPSHSDTFHYATHTIGQEKYRCIWARKSLRKNTEQNKRY